MKKMSSHFLGLLLIVLFSNAAMATEAVAPTPIPAPAPTATTTTAIEPYKALTWSQLVQKKYNLTEQQMTTLTSAKLTNPDLARVAEIAKLSNKSVDDILKMRADKKAWGLIVKELGLDPKVIAQSISSLRKEAKDERKKEHDSKKAEAKQKHDDAKKERDAKREEKKKEHAEKEKAHHEHKERDEKTEKKDK